MPRKHASAHAKHRAQAKSHPSHRRQSRGDRPKAGLPRKNSQKKTQPQQKTRKNQRVATQNNRKNKKVKKNLGKTGSTRAQFRTNQQFSGFLSSGKRKPRCASPVLSTQRGYSGRRLSPFNKASPTTRQDLSNLFTGMKKPPRCEGVLHLAVM